MDHEPIQLTPEIQQTFQPAKAFRENQKAIMSLSFDDLGELCVVASEDESLNLYDCQQGVHKATLYSKKYGVNLVRFTHGKNNAIYASTKENDAIRYHSLHDNKYIRYFKGHEKRVVSLEMCPSEDQFMSSSLDETARLWDLRSPDSLGVVHVNGRSCVAFDPAGLVFALGVHSRTIKMYDRRDYEKGPFETWTIDDPTLRHGIPEWTSLKFTNDGKHMLISTTGRVHYLVDAFDGSIKKRLSGYTSAAAGGANGDEISLSPDARFVYGACKDGSISVWDLHAPSHEVLPIVLRNPQQQSISVVAFNPTHLMMATGGSDLVFWLPSTQ